MALVAAAFPGEEAVLAHVKVEALQTAVSEPVDWILFTDVTFSLVLSSLRSGEPVEDGQPDHALGFLFHPLQEVQGLNQIAVSGLLEARPDAGVDVDTTESLSLAQDPGDLDTVTEQQTQLTLV